jgi:hypothetical protein
MQPAAAAPPHPSRPPHCQRPPMAARQSTLHAENHLPPKTRASTRPRLRRPAAAGWTRRAGSARLSAEPGRVELYSRLLPAPLSPLHSSLRCGCGSSRSRSRRQAEAVEGASQNRHATRSAVHAAVAVVVSVRDCAGVRAAIARSFSPVPPWLSPASVRGPIDRWVDDGRRCDVFSAISAA